MSTRTLPLSPARSAALVVALALSSACAAASPYEARLDPMPLDAAAPPVELTENHFKRDVMGDVDEAQLREILAAPVYLEAHARIGILPVASGYTVDEEIPTGVVPDALETALTESGQFEVVSEMTTDWPHAGGSIGGLRELAARYRAEYILLTRSRFVSRSHANAWTLGWLTFIGGFVLPNRTMEVAGVVEATLLDVKTGTLLFTTYVREYGKSQENVWQNDRKRADMKLALAKKATKGLTDKVLDQIRRLVAARPERPAATRPAAASPPPVAPAEPATPAATAAPGPTEASPGSAAR